MFGEKTKYTILQLFKDVMHGGKFQYIKESGPMEVVLYRPVVI